MPKNRAPNPENALSPADESRERDTLDPPVGLTDGVWSWDGRRSELAEVLRVGAAERAFTPERLGGHAAAVSPWERSTTDWNRCLRAARTSGTEGPAAHIEADLMFRRLWPLGSDGSPVTDLHRRTHQWIGHYDDARAAGLDANAARLEADDWFREFVLGEPRGAALLENSPGDPLGADPPEPPPVADVSPPSAAGGGGLDDEAARDAEATANAFASHARTMTEKALRAWYWSSHEQFFELDRGLPAPAAWNLATRTIELLTDKDANLFATADRILEARARAFFEFQERKSLMPEQVTVPGAGLPPLEPVTEGAAPEPDAAPKKRRGRPPGSGKKPAAAVLVDGAPVEPPPRAPEPRGKAPVRPPDEEREFRKLRAAAAAVAEALEPLPPWNRGAVLELASAILARADSERRLGNRIAERPIEAPHDETAPRFELRHPDARAELARVERDLRDTLDILAALRGAVTI